MPRGGSSVARYPGGWHERRGEARRDRDRRLEHLGEPLRHRRGEAGDTWFGTSAELLVTDFVEELQVKSSATARVRGLDRGRPQRAHEERRQRMARRGACLLGRGQARRRAASDPAPRPDRRDRRQYVTYSEDQYDRLEPGFTLSGPIVRDRLWFFAGYIPSFRPLDRKVTVPGRRTTGTYHQQPESPPGRPEPVRAGRLTAGARARPSARATSGRTPSCRRRTARATRTRTTRSATCTRTTPSRRPSTSPKQPRAPQPACRLLLQQLVQRRRLPRRPVLVCDLGGGPPRRSPPVPAAARLHQRADELGRRQADGAAPRDHLRRHRLLRRRRPAPAEGGHSIRPTRPRHPVGQTGNGIDLYWARL